MFVRDAVEILVACLFSSDRIFLLAVYLGFFDYKKFQTNLFDLKPELGEDGWWLDAPNPTDGALSPLL